MYIADIFLFAWLCGLTAGTLFLKNGQGITDMTNHPIPADTTTVYLDTNSISHVPSGYFVNLSSLTGITLQGNLISEIDPHAFAAVPSVTIIILADNKLEVIRENMFSGLPNLQDLRLHNNLLHTVKPASFRDNTALTYLYMHYNALQTLPQCMFDPDNHPQSLYDLRIHGNPLSCDQQLCWLKRPENSWISFWYASSPVCAGPGGLNARTWNSITTHELHCDAAREYRPFEVNLFPIFFKVLPMKKCIDSNSFIS